MNAGTAHLIDVRRTGWAGVDALRLVAAPGDVVYATGGLDGLEALRGVRIVHLSAPTGRPELAWRALRSILRDGRPALVHAWTVNDLLLARLGAPGTRRIATVFDPPGRASFAACVLAQFAFDGAQAVSFASAALRDAWSALDGSIRSAPIHAPPIEADARSAAARDDVRSGWGVECDDERVVVYVGSRSAATDARLATHLTGLLMLAGEKPRCVLAPRAHGLERATRYTRRLEGAWRLVAESRPARDWMHGADLCVACSPHSDATQHRTSHDQGDAAPTLSWALALRVPVVAQDAPAARAVVDESCAVMVPANDHAGLARALGASNHRTDASRARVEAGAARVATMCDAGSWRAHVEALRLKNR